MNRSAPATRQSGVTLIELMVTLVITLFLVTAAAYVYLGTRETQRAVDRSSANREIGSFALEMLGRDIMNAGFFPRIEVVPQTAGSAYHNYSASAYPPNNWTPTSTVYLSGIFGCDGTRFNPATGACDINNIDGSDSIVINYFTSDPEKMGSQIGTRFDCAGARVDKDDGNNLNRKLNSPLGASPPTLYDENYPPGLPLFVSNRYALVSGANTTIDQQALTSKNLSCSGNGNGNSYQPLLLGLEDLQFSYAVYSGIDPNATDARLPPRFYTATEVSDMTPIIINSITYGGWSRVVAVRVCLMTSNLGASPRITDKTGAERSYINCKDDPVKQPATDTTLHQRFVQVFGVRNNLNTSY